MHVTHLTLRDFRNYDRLELKLEVGTTLFYGPNAAGKTTILDVGAGVRPLVSGLVVTDPPDRPVDAAHAPARRHRSS